LTVKFVFITIATSSLEMKGYCHSSVKQKIKCTLSAAQCE